VTVESSSNRAQYATNGTTGPWTVPFYFLDNSHIQVIHTDSSGNETVLTLTTHYSVTGAGVQAGGTVTTVTAYSTTVPASYITVLRNVPALQQTDYVDGDKFPAATHEQALDKLTMLIQQLLEVTNRALVFSPSDTAGSALPAVSARANKLIGFDSLGRVSMNVPVAGTAAALATQLLNTLLVTEGDALIGSKETRFANAPALTLHKWIEGGIVNAKRQALPSNFVFATDDAYQYLQNLIADCEALQSRLWVALPGSDTWRIGTRLTLNSDYGTGICGIGGKPIVKWVGATHNTGTQDNENGAMVYFSGLDHVWGGIDNILLDADSKANHCVFLRGDVTTGFRLRDLHCQYPQLDCLRVLNSGTATPVSMIVEGFSAYPYTSFGGVNGVCGRYVINVTVNNSVGLITLRNGNADNGVSGFIAIQSDTGFAGTDVSIENWRFEQNRANGSLIVLNYTAAAPIGALTLRNLKHAIGAGGSSSTNLVNNISAGAVRPDIFVDMLTLNDGFTNIYNDSNDSGKTVAYDVGEHRNSVFKIEHNSTVGSYPSVARMQGKTRILSPSTPYTVTKHDHDKRIDTQSVGANPMTINLPAVAAVGIGFKVHVSALHAAVVTVDPNGAETIDGAATLATDGSANRHATFEVVSAGRWAAVVKTGTWV